MSEYTGAVTQLARGIAPDLLVSQVKNTMPYLFAGAEGAALAKVFPPARFVLECNSESHFEYFRLCISAHYLTCATPVPTDVDNQIRRKLWPSELPLEMALEMTELVLESRSWDFTRVSARTIEGLSGHLGEWFTIAAAAYGALGRYRDPRAQEKRNAVFEAISEEVNRHSETFGTLWREKRGLDALKASSVIAHNFGDLDRVMDMWELGAEDPLRIKYYKLGVEPFDRSRKLRFLGRLWVAGELYKSPIEGSSMAMENHRHFALRKPRSLRQKNSFLIPIGPFFDSWGKTVAEGLRGEGEILEVAEALKQGWDRLAQSVGYGRALRSVFEIHPDLEKALGKASEFSKSQRQVLSTRQEIFEKHWGEKALYWMNEIPGKAS